MPRDRRTYFDDANMKILYSSRLVPLVVVRFVIESLFGAGGGGAPQAQSTRAIASTETEVRMGSPTNPTGRGERADRRESRRRRSGSETHRSGRPWVSRDPEKRRIEGTDPAASAYRSRQESSGGHACPEVSMHSIASASSRPAPDGERRRPSRRTPRIKTRSRITRPGPTRRGSDACASGRP